MEDFKRMGYDDVDVDVDVYSGTNTYYDTDYYLEATVQADTPATDTKTIKVDVYWDPATPASGHKVELKTIIAQ
jgi:hypothetical protein